MRKTIYNSKNMKKPPTRMFQVLEYYNNKCKYRGGGRMLPNNNMDYSFYYREKRYKKYTYLLENNSTDRSSVDKLIYLALLDFRLNGYGKVGGSGYRDSFLCFSQILKHIPNDNETINVIKWLISKYKKYGYDIGDLHSTSFSWYVSVLYELILDNCAENQDLIDEYLDFLRVRYINEDEKVDVKYCSYYYERILKYKDYNDIESIQSILKYIFVDEHYSYYERILEFNPYNTDAIEGVINCAKENMYITDYQSARACYNTILKYDKGNERALDGLRMVKNAMKYDRKRLERSGALNKKDRWIYEGESWRVKEKKEECYVQN